jgi:hypothetical protein
LGLAAVLVFGGLYASNMGFKINRDLTAPPGKAGTGSTIIALPYYQQTDLLDAKDLIDDIETSTGQPGVVNQIARYLKDSDGFAGYTGTSGVAFPLVPGEAYLLQVDVNAVGVNYIGVGSHNPGLVINLLGPSAGVSASGSNLYAYPYHSVATDAKELIDEVNAAGGGGVVVQVAQYLTEVDGFASYTGTSGVAFALEPGVGYLIQVNTDVSFVPAHF